MKLDYQVICSPRQTVSLTVERDGAVVVRAPIGTCRERIQKAVESKKLWLFGKSRNGQKYPAHRRRKEFVPGETILYLGRNYRLDVVDREVPGVEFCSRFLISRRNQSLAPRLFREWYQHRAESHLAKKTKHFAAAMGVHFNRLLVSDLRFSWASCTLKANLNFNWRVMKASPFVIDYQCHPIGF